jgi:prepilin-type N-terminal cleavage/methylation domain-containing protein
MSSKRGGFTFIEILMTLALIGLLFVPTMQLFSNSLFSTNMNLDLITATNLAQSEMEKTINLNLTKTQLQELGTQLIPPANEEPFKLNKGLWRVRREIVENSDPVEVRIFVFREGEPEKPLVKLVTLFEDMMWDSVKAISST